MAPELVRPVFGRVAGILWWRIAVKRCRSGVVVVCGRSMGSSGRPDGESDRGDEGEGGEGEGGEVEAVEECGAGNFE